MTPFRRWGWVNGRRGVSESGQAVWWGRVSRLDGGRDCQLAAVPCRWRPLAPERRVVRNSAPYLVYRLFIRICVVRIMSNYVRPRVGGATVFFTVALADRGLTLLTVEVELLRSAVNEARALRPFHIDAWVVLPDHLHCIWTLPVGDADYSARWGSIKHRFSRRLPVGRQRSSHVRRREKAIWQSRFLGASSSRRCREDRGCSVLSGEPGQARVGRSGSGLALQFGPPGPDGIDTVGCAIAHRAFCDVPLNGAQ